MPVTADDRDRFRRQCEAQAVAWRPKDQDDIASILAAGHDLDHEYLDHWIQDWSVEDRWQAARNFGQ